MLAFFVGRLARISLTAVAVVTIVFFMFQVVPGDQAALLAGATATDDEILAIRAELGHDRPLHSRYGRYLAGLLRADFGYSTTFQGNPLRHILARLPATISLLTTTLLLTLAVGLPAGAVAAVSHRTAIDVVVTVAVAGLLAVPNFWLGLMLVSLLAVELQWFPSFGFTGWTSLLLPSLALSARLIALVARMTRGVVLDELQKDYVRTARAKGIRESSILAVHLLRNASVPLITVVGLQAGYLLGGSIVIERLFAWPGLGELMMNGVGMRDYSLVQGITLIYVSGFLVINFIVDCAYFVANPVLRGSSGV